MATDPYLYPETRVLKNLPGIKDAHELEVFEAVATSGRIAELRFAPILGLFDVVHLQRIHRHIFQDLYSWAGDL
jgi:cell filamentation protein